MKMIDYEKLGIDFIPERYKTQIDKKENNCIDLKYNFMNFYLDKLVKNKKITFDQYLELKRLFTERKELERLSMHFEDKVSGMVERLFEKGTKRFA